MDEPVNNIAFRYISIVGICRCWSCTSLLRSVIVQDTHSFNSRFTRLAKLFTFQSTRYF